MGRLQLVRRFRQKARHLAFLLACIAIPLGFGLVASLDAQRAVRLNGVTTLSGAISVPGPFTLTTGQILVPDGTAPLPSYSFTSEPTLGLRRTASATGYWSSNISATALGIGPVASTTGMILNGGGTGGITMGSLTQGVAWTGGNEQNAVQVNLSRISSGVLGLGTGAQGSFAGTLKLAALSKMAGTGTQLGDAGTTIYSDLTATGSTGGGAEADVSSYPMPGNTLSSNGMAVQIWVCATHAANTNSTTLRTYFNGTALSTITEATSTATPCTDFRIVRTTSTTMTYTGYNSGTTNGLTRSAGTMSGIDFTAAITIKYSVQAATTTNDLIGSYQRVMHWPQ